MGPFTKGFVRGWLLGAATFAVGFATYFVLVALL